MDFLNFFVVFILGICSCVTAVTIKQLRVPDIIENGAQKSAILDCDYDSNNEDGLVVKWYFQDDPKPIYQWIPSHKPQSLGIMKDRVDLDYKVTNDESTMYRAIYIKQLSPDLSGEYKCVVSSFENEAELKKKMIIFEPAKLIEIVQVAGENDAVVIYCSAYGIYPRPNMTISMSAPLDNNSFFEEVDQEVVDTDDGLYNVTALLKISQETLDDPTEFVCDLSIPGTLYHEKKTLTYYPGGPPTTEHVDYESSGISSGVNSSLAFRSTTWMMGLSTLMSILLVFRMQNINM